jgi:hypothetical protein
MTIMKPGWSMDPKLKVISIPDGDLAIWGPADGGPDNPK